ncbi:MAG: RsmB/NOP family class I SAM-dependent RNA methyltransferase [Alphaproteobacteria bacterium]|nr:RsmB/NOP family class I SAM-dependent RNA methyltransferase [Alphaproteobacteria bacterium]
MTPGAQVEAAIGLLADIDKGTAPADDLVAEWFRRHRFAGSSDRAAISGHIYAVLRHRAELDWWIGRTGGGLPADARNRMLAVLVLFEGWRASQVREACDGDRFRPAALNERENALISSLAGREALHPDMPSHVRGNYPEWLDPHLAASLGKDVARETAALNGEASLDLRANLLKVKDRGEARIALKRDGVEAEITALSPLGLRLSERVPLGSIPAFKSGLLEVQDEGSQIAAQMADAKPGMRVVDFCAGAGGKTLALAASMRNKGHLIASDISSRRLERATERLRRAGASIVQRVPLKNARDPWVKKHKASFDRVFVDAPCTGTGTWRRNPDAKWRLTPEDLAELTALQAEILDSAARLVKPGGRLVYATCSLLREEDEEQVEKFLAAHADFTLLPAWRVWRDTIGGKPPDKGAMLRLTPARHGTDGFFVAILERKAVAPDAQPQG